MFLQPILNTSAVQPPTINEAFVEDVKATGIPFSLDAEDRVFRGHGKKSVNVALVPCVYHKFNVSSCLHFLSGHCLHEIFALREGKLGRVPDMVVWPSEFRIAVIAVFLLARFFNPPS